MTAKKKKQPKVLICTPTSAYKDYCLPEWSEAIKKLTYPADIIIVDNSKNKNHRLEFTKHDFGRKTWIVTAPPIKEDTDLRYTMCRCNNFALNFAIENGYEYMMSIESDVFPPCDDAIETLLEHDKDVCGFAYFIGEYHRSIPIIQSRFTFDDGRCADYIGKDSFERFFDFDGTLREVPNLGLGFVLINLKNVFSKIPNFRISEKEFYSQGNDSRIHADTFFYTDLARIGIKTWCDTRYICDHHNNNWFKIWDKEIKK